jgi:Fe-S-cluster-containing hydrogenase component 2/CRP-like cAMP-binding protein
MSEPAAPTPKPPAPAIAKTREVAVAPEARLELREGVDVRIAIGDLNKFRDCISLFTDIKSKPNLEKSPDTIVLRRYNPGDIVCRQGEAGNSAFYVITRDDESRLRAAGFIEPERTLAEVALNEDALTVHLAFREAAAKPKGWFARLTVGTSRAAESRASAQYIPIDAPVGVSFETRTASLGGGDLFGEMSCLSGTPRSATIVAERKVYVIEVLRNIFDQLRRDKKFQEKMAEKYKQRVLGLQLLNLPLFQNLPEHLVELLKQKVKLRNFKHGEVVFDEHDRSTAMYIVRSGVVKVVKGASSLYAVRDVLDWAAFARRLSTAAPGTVAATVRGVMPPDVRARLADPLDATTDPPWAQAAVDALNELIKGPDLAEAVATIDRNMTMVSLLENNAGIRKVNREVLDKQFPSLRPWRAASGPVTVITYRSQGELVGEMGVLLKQPRSATCIAHGNEADDPAAAAGTIDRSSKPDVAELVEISDELFDFIMGQPDAAEFRRHVEERAQERAHADKSRRTAAEGAALGRSQRVSPEFERLNLIQGQRLMLIDLDRCTRCDECVRACADVHDDGRSRLFLEGPRFEHYLVPLTCRSCLNPVCLVGCPVGSIRRGKNLEIQIEDWCIGCGLCAKNCPFGSIQMHDVGVIPAGARGWRFRADPTDGSVVPTNFKNWATGPAPFRMDRDFREAAGGPAGAYWFAYDFGVDDDLLARDNPRAGTRAHDFEIELFGPDCPAAVYVNRRPMEHVGKYKGNSKSRLVAVNDPAKLLSAGSWWRPRPNVVVVRIAPPPVHHDTLFDLRLDATPAAIKKEDEKEHVRYQQKGVQERAVVCDLCSNQPGQKPACVNACPHEAAFRVDARVNFPVR